MTRRDVSFPRRSPHFSSSLRGIGRPPNYPQFYPQFYPPSATNVLPARHAIASSTSSLLIYVHGHAIFLRRRRVLEPAAMTLFSKISAEVDAAAAELDALMQVRGHTSDLRLFFCGSRHGQTRVPS